MLERLQNVLRNRKESDQGFSLVELAVVIVVIGILVAIAVPVFIGIQDGAKEANAKALAANGSAIVASVVAQDKTPTADDFATLVDSKSKLAVTGSSLTNYCVQAEYDGKYASKGTGTCTDPTAAVTTGVTWGSDDD